MSNVANVVPLYMADNACRAFSRLIGGCCEKWEVAGSVRRRLQTVHDLEFVAIGSTEFRTTDSLFPVEVNVLDELMAEVSAGNVPHVKRCPPQNGRSSPWGERYKKLLFEHAGRWFVIDLFLVTPETWGAQLAIRTGPADFSRLLVTSRRFGGAMPDGWKLSEGRLHTPDGMLKGCHTSSEREFFAILKLPCWEPRLRSVRVLQEYLGVGHAGCDRH